MLNDTETAAAPPGSAMTPSQIKKLKIAIAVMSVLLVAGFILLLVGLYFQMQKSAKPPEGSAAFTPPVGIYGTMTLPVRAGAEVTHVLVGAGTPYSAPSPALGERNRHHRPHHGARNTAP